GGGRGSGRARADDHASGGGPARAERGQGDHPRPGASSDEGRVSGPSEARHGRRVRHALGVHVRAHCDRARAPAGTLHQPRAAPGHEPDPLRHPRRSRARQAHRGPGRRPGRLLDPRLRRPVPADLLRHGEHLDVPGRPRHALDQRRDQPDLRHRRLPAVRRADRAGDRAERPPGRAARVRRHDAPVLQLQGASQARGPACAGQHLRPGVLRGRHEGPGPHEAWGPCQRDRRDARVPEGAARGALRALPDDGGRARGPLVAGPGGALLGVRGVGGDRAGARVVRAARRRMDGLTAAGGNVRRREGGEVVASDGNKEFGYERLGAKRLTLIDVLAQSVGFIGPVFSSAFIIPLIIGVNVAARGAGTSAPLAVILAGVGVFALGWIVAQYAKRIHAAGSLYDYVTNGLGRTMGAASGWLYYGGTIMLTTGLGVLLGGYVHDSLLPAFNVGPWLPVWAWDTILAVLLFAALYFGVQISTRVQLTLALLSIAVVLIFFATVIGKLGSGNDLAKAFDPTPADGFSGILFGVLYGVLIFVGFETAANLAEETADPKRSIPRAVLGAVVLVSLWYLIASYVEVAGFHFDLKVITSPQVSGAPLFALGAPGTEFGSDLWLKVLLVVVFLDMLAVYVGAAVASTRGTFAMARDRRLPAPLAGVSERYGTPTGAIVLLLVVQAVLIVAAEANS